MIPTTRLRQAYYLTDTVKLRYLLRISYQEGLFTGAATTVPPVYSLADGDVDCGNVP
jgi:hypothetical protein